MSKGLQSDLELDEASAKAEAEGRKPQEHIQPTDWTQRKANEVLQNKDNQSNERNQVNGKPVTTQYFSSSPSLQDCHEKATRLEEKCANLQHNYADLAAQQKRMQWALTVISALPIEFVDKQQQLTVKAAIANYMGDGVSIIGLVIRWGFRNLNLDRDNTIKVFEGQTKVGEVASADLREDKLFAVAGPGVGVFKGWELYCVTALFQKENDARRAVEVLNQSPR
ncbi:hypothetical protein GE21DRAFT_10726, partial [Neurospora crassa]